MLLARRDPKCDILLHQCLLSLVHADSSAGDDVDQFRPVVAMVISATVRRKDGMAEGDFLDTFLVWSEQHLNLTPEGGRNLDPFFFPSLNYFQVTFLSCVLSSNKAGAGIPFCGV